ncbi:type IX secretion system plug protein domain-containing protein [Winogradskyella sp. 3972H.M.0a.05]|uniref:type IX secretion system plug protein n=1 Tax=Winogradskyella sp. 3972H.M.0a.05 TaxID=2950277 RepID=UPI0033929E16
MIKNIKHFLCFALFPLIGLAQVQEVNPPDFIKTITFRGTTNEGQLPVIRLGEPLYLEFDAVNGNEEDFYYVIEHYNFDWTKSNLVKGEYLRGMDNQRIFNYENSFNTYQIYSHYMLKIPNQQTRGLLKSGNYIISIYDDYDELMFSRKFMIYEDLVNVGVSIKRSRDVRFVNEKQSVDYVVSTNSINFINPMENIKTVIIQNNNLNTVISNLRPQYTLGNELIYRYNTESSFWAGNEFMFFENKDIRAANVGVQFTDLQDIYHNYLFLDINRSEQPYTYNPDINGNFLVNVLDRDPRVEADYAMIHFSLLYPDLKAGESIHVYGNFNNYAITEETKLAFNPDTNNYECTMKLKQGFYNYKYVIVDADGNIDEGAISGNYWQTENNYKVLVYYRDIGARFDRLIGFGEGNSVNISN